MTSSKALGAGLLAALAMAALAPMLGSNGGAGYAEVTQPALLFAASALAVRVSFMYRSMMKALFIALAAFLLLFGIVTLTILVDAVSDALDENFLRVLLGYQLFTYAFLIAAMIVTVRLTGLGKIQRPGQLVLGSVVILAIVIVSNSFSTFSEIGESSAEAAALYLVIRILDVVVMVLVTPALVLFVQNARSRHQESLTFAVIGASIIASLVFVYIYELVSGDSLLDIAFRDYQQGSFLDALYIFGYAALVAGMYAHWRHQEWSMRAVERALGFDERPERP